MVYSLTDILRYAKKSTSKLYDKAKENPKTTVAIAVGASTGFYLGAHLLAYYGFSASGVTGGSNAALWQSSVGNVAAGSAFAQLQSLGATGVGSNILGLVGGALGASAVSLRFLRSKL